MFTIVDFDASGRPLLEIDGSSMTARSTVEVDHRDRGREALVTFVNGDPLRPVITGLLVDSPQDGRYHLRIRAEEIDFSAASKITLECGRASITLHRSGKVVVKGAELLSRASGTNRIRGGTIELN